MKQRNSRQRNIILDELRKVYSHPSADEIYQIVRKKLPNISLGTVYRNLEKFCEQGIVKKLEYASSKKRYDGNLELHYHFNCQECGKIEDIPLDVITPKLNKDHPWVKKRKVLGNRLEYFGLCSFCLEKNG